MVIAYPPWQLTGQYYPESYGTAENSAIHLQALSIFNGYDPYIEILYCVGTRLAVGVIAKFYFAAVRYRDNLLSTLDNGS